VQTAYHPAFGENVRYSFDRLPDSPDAQVRATIRKMISYIRQDARSCPGIWNDAQRAIQIGGGDPVSGIWKLIKQSMRFQRDEVTAAQLDTSDIRKQDAIEVFIRPCDQSLLIQMKGIGVEDCDGFELYAACMFLVLGIPISLVTVTANEAVPKEFSHVYLAAYLNSQRIPLDFSHGSYPGWECPNLGKLKEWPVQMTYGEKFCELAIATGLFAGAYFGLKAMERAA